MQTAGPAAATAAGWWLAPAAAAPQMPGVLISLEHTSQKNTTVAAPLNAG